MTASRVGSKTPKFGFESFFIIPIFQGRFFSWRPLRRRSGHALREILSMKALPHFFSCPAPRMRRATSYSITVSLR